MGEPGSDIPRTPAELEAEATKQGLAAVQKQQPESTDTESIKSEPVDPLEVGRALLEEDRRLGGNMHLVVAPTKESSGDDSTTLLFSTMRRRDEMGAGVAVYRAFGVNSERGLVYYQQRAVQQQQNTWGENRLKLPEYGLTSANLTPVKSPEDMEEWTSLLNATRERAERTFERQSKQTEFERSLPQKALEAIKNTPLPAIPPQGQIQ